MSDERKDLAEKIRWLLLLRVVILSFFLGAAALFHFFGRVVELGYLFGLTVPLIVAYGISIASAVLLPRLQNLRPMAYAQLGFDVLLVTGIIWITGDSTSPFSFLYNLAVMNGAILLFYRGAFVTAACSSLCYTALLFWARLARLEYGIALSWSALMPVAYSIGSFFVIAWLSGFLANKLSETEKRLKEKQLDFRELDAFKDALLQGIGSGVAITDDDGRINYFNPHAQALAGLGEDAVRGKSLSQIFPGLSYDFQRHRNFGSVITEELPFLPPKGQPQQIRVTLAPLSSVNGKPVGFVTIFDDITKQKQFEEKLRLEEELRRAREVQLEPRPVGTDNGQFQFEGVIGKSGGVEKIHQLVQKVAAGNTNVLISGESGTGKELIARAIHRNGPRRHKPFVAVNCGAIPETLIESELFGHVRGAFTGAVADHIGLFKQADQGTIFLDEVGELPLHLQVKLLRVLQEKSFTPVGGSKALKVDVRVISATNRDLRKEMEEGRFREDLFYRLNVVQVVMPPLRDRREDIPELADYFLQRFAASLDKKVEEISGEALMRLMSYSYPGNVRELENMIEHAVAVTNKNVVSEDDLPQHIKGVPIADEADLFEKTAPGGPEQFFAKGLSLDTELETHEKCILLGALKRAKGVQKRAAEILGINYRSLRHRLEKYDMLNLKGDSLIDQPTDRE